MRIVYTPLSPGFRQGLTLYRRIGDNMRQGELGRKSGITNAPRFVPGSSLMAGRGNVQNTFAPPSPADSVTEGYKMYRKILIALLICLFATTQSFAHSGGLDANGCHGGSKPYHCHRSASDMVKTETGHYRLRCDLGSRSQKCVDVYEDEDEDDSDW